jgi:polysaccharide export outer membrane protein
LFPRIMMAPLQHTGALLAFLAMTLAGCAVTTTNATLKVKTEVLDSLRRYEVAYLIQPGDQVEVFVYRQPDFTRKTVVRPDGYISLPLLGDVKAAGKAPRILGEELTKLYEVRLRNPEVTVIVDNAQEPMVYVVGDVATPRAVPVRQVKTVAQAIAMAGNAVRTASLSDVSVIRINSEGVLEAHVVETDAYNQPQIYMALQNMPVMPNDLVVVPESYRGQTVRALQDINSLLAPFFQVWLIHEVTKPQ